MRFSMGLQATAGGGGRGMRLAQEPGEFVKLLQVILHVFCLQSDWKMESYIPGQMLNLGDGLGSA
jgi:biotin carboxylase